MVILTGADGSAQTQDSFLENYLSGYFKTNQFSIFPLAGDASSRRYYRVVKDDQSWVLMRWEPFDPKEYPFLSVQSHFHKNGILVPQVAHMAPDIGLVLLEDLGDLTLERKFWENQNQEPSLPFYKAALDEILKIHFTATDDVNSDCTAFKVKFDTEKLLWEMNYGKENLLAGMLKFPFDDKISKELHHVFFSICSILDAEPKRIQHRDYHSRNVMIKFNKVRVIDFQDARLGPIQYDLVSLLKDSYVNLSDEMAQQMLEYYLTTAASKFGYSYDRSHFDYIYELQTIQRCFKACGSFSSFYVQRGDTRYLKYISGTLKRVLKSLTLFPEYKVFSDILIDSGALERKYEVT